MDKYIKILLLFIFAFILAPNSYACYDDWEDDSFDGGWICDYDDIVCTPDDDDDWGNDDWDNDDWWYNDDPNDDWWNDDETWENDLWDNDDENKNCYTGQTSEKNDTIHSTTVLDEATTLCCSIDTLKSIFILQEHKGTCIPAGLNYIAQIFGKTTMTETKINLMVTKITKQANFITQGIITTAATGWQLQGLAETIGLHHCLIPSVEAYDIHDAINKGYAIMTTIQTDEIGSKLHNVIVVGYGNDVYIAWDTSKGQYITLMPNDLTLKYCVGIKK